VLVAEALQALVAPQFREAMELMVLVAAVALALLEGVREVLAATA